MIALSFEPQPVVQDLYDLANAEGELLSVAAKMRLGIDEERDEDGFTDNEYVLTDIAYQLAQALVFGRFTHSASEPLLHDVLALGEKVNRKLGSLFLYRERRCKVLSGTGSDRIFIAFA